jgi:hypothetical protein
MRTPAAMSETRNKGCPSWLKLDWSTCSLRRFIRFSMATEDSDGQGCKGGQDRDVMLSPLLLEELRAHWRRLRQKVHLVISRQPLAQRRSPHRYQDSLPRLRRSGSLRQDQETCLSPRAPPPLRPIRFLLTAFSNTTPHTLLSALSTHPGVASEKALTSSARNRRAPNGDNTSPSGLREPGSVRGLYMKFFV